MKLLVTGGTGYIGSHTCVELLKAGHELVVIDNLSNSRIEVITRIEAITSNRLIFHRMDLLHREELIHLFRQYAFDGVLHFAGLKAVAESVTEPLWYYHNNLTGTLNLCHAMATAEVRNLVFSSSATVYGQTEDVPLRESLPVSSAGPINPYGRSKAMIEAVLGDLHRSDDRWNLCMLRYFNPVGAHASGLIGEDPKGIPNNLLPYITRVALGQLPELVVFGNDYPTPDGTPIRDYIHVVDLAAGHVAAIEALTEPGGVSVYNLGTGQGYSVLEMINAFRKVNRVDIPYSIGPRRSGDLAVSFADPGRANSALGWKATLGLEDICRDAWNWQQKNPDGYASTSS